MTNKENPFKKLKEPLYVYKSIISFRDHMQDYVSMYAYDHGFIDIGGKGHKLTLQGHWFIHVMESDSEFQHEIFKK